MFGWLRHLFVGDYGPDKYRALKGQSLPALIKAARLTQHHDPALEQTPQRKFAGAAPLPMVVCDGWTDPKHARRVLVQGVLPMSHGMCDDCRIAMEILCGLADVKK